MNEMTQPHKTLRRHHTAGAVTFVTATTRQRRPIFHDPPHAACAMQALYELRETGMVKLVAFVVMPDHVHLLMRLAGGTTVSEVMHRYKWDAGRILRAARGNTRLWERRFYDRTVRSEDELRATVAYIDWNPVKAGLCEMPEEYRFSSAYPDNPTDELDL